MGKRVAISEALTLPSEGKAYNGKIPSEFNLRAMSTLEEKIRLSSTNGMKVIPQIIDRCKDVETFSAEDLITADLLAAMYKLRCVTYGNEYKVTLKCPNCGDTIEVTVDLDELGVKKVPDDFNGIIEIGPLPKSKDVVTCRLMTIRDNNNLERDARRTLSKNPEYVGNPEMILRWNYIIESINGNKLNTLQVQQYIESLHAQDFIYLTDKYNEFEESIGLDINLVDVCPHCNNDIKFLLPVTEEFFRPRY